MHDYASILDWIVKTISRTLHFTTLQLNDFYSCIDIHIVPTRSVHFVPLQLSSTSHETGLRYLLKAAESGHRAAMIETALALDSGEREESRYISSNIICMNSWDTIKNINVTIDHF